MNIVKVSVESLDGKQNILYDYDKNAQIEENIVQLLAKFEMPTKTHAYGLRLIQTNSGKLVDVYVTADNFNDIKDGYFLKIVYSVAHQVNTIFLLLDNGDRKTCFDNLAHHCGDEGFIKEIAKQEKHSVILGFFFNQKDMTDDETVACLLTIIHLFKLGFIDFMSVKFLNKLLLILKEDPNTHTDQIKYTLSLLQKIMTSKNPKLDPWKEKIVKLKRLQEITPYIRIPNEDLQYLTVLLVNTFVRHTTGIQRLHAVRELNYKQTKADIYTHIIQRWPNMDGNMEYELYVYQTFLLSLYNDALNSKTKLDEDKRKEFELDHKHRNFAERLTSMIEFEESVNRMRSMENLLETIDEYRNQDTYSLCEMDEILRHSRININEDSTGEISYLTLEALKSSTMQQQRRKRSSWSLDSILTMIDDFKLTYYKKYHNKNFCQTQIEETFFGPGIFVTSESIVKILANVLQIGKEPDNSKVKYTFQPTVFNATARIPFFYELFSRTIWLLSKTKNEMKSCPVPEYHKLMKVVEKQIIMVLEHRPGTFKKLTSLMMKTNYNAVMQKWQEEANEDFEAVLKYNPCVLELRKRYMKANEEIVYQQRMNYLINGSVFYKINDQKKIDHCFMKLSENKKYLLCSDFDEKLKKIKGEPKEISISNISHLVQGKACPHKINSITKDNNLIFSLIIEASYINIIAKDLKEGCYWLDGLHMLLEKETRSEYYHNELQELIKMDLSLHLMELQNVTLPKSPPPVPPPPILTKKPNIPVKLRLLPLKKYNDKF